MLTEITKCEVCDNPNLINTVNLGSQPLCDDLVPIGDDRVCNKYPIEILFCDECKTAHQRFQVPKGVLFPPTYHYRARQTNDVLDGMVQFADAVEKHWAVRNLHVLDIGCNDGSLLNIFKERGARTFGFEPTAAYKEAGGHIVINDFFSPASARKYRDAFGCPDVITFTNVFAHIENLEEVIVALRIIMKPETILVIENHYLGSVIERHQFDTFYHEHPRTYSYTSFLHIAKKLGMYVEWVEFPKRYGGNIRVVMKYGSHPGIPPQKLVQCGGALETDFAFRLAQLHQSVKRWKRNKLAEIDRAVVTFPIMAPIPAAAFPGRAAIAINLLGLTNYHVTTVYENAGSKKAGHYVPGTRIPILLDTELDMTALTNTPVINFAWHIAEEVEANWRAKGFRGRFIRSITEDDFR